MKIILWLFGCRNWTCLSISANLSSFIFRDRLVRWILGFGCSERIWAICIRSCILILGIRRYNFRMLWWIRRFWRVSLAISGADVWFFCIIECSNIFASFSWSKDIFYSAFYHSFAWESWSEDSDSSQTFRWYFDWSLSQACWVCKA